MNKNYEYHALGSYKEKIIELLTTHELSDALMDILMPVIEDARFDKVDNFVGGEFQHLNNGEVEIVKLKKHLFDVPFIYSTVTDMRNVICIDTNVTRCDKTLKQMSIKLFIMCHKEGLQIDKETKKKYKKMGYIGDNRMDIAVALIGDILNGCNAFGLGKFVPQSFNPTESYYPNTDFFGKILNYTSSDFMKDYSKEL